MMTYLPQIQVKKSVDEFFADKGYKHPTTLCAIMSSFGSDKGDGRHNYTTLYSRLFLPWKNQKIRLFELGIGTNSLDVPSNMGLEGKPGASLYGWSLYFPHADIYGADIDKKILFNDQKIKTFYCDQCNETSIHELFSQTELKDLEFDIMIDDGLHQYEANLHFLTHSMHKLRKGGLYFIEDLDAASRMAFIDRLPELRNTFDLTYIEVIIIPYNMNRFDNSLLVIQK